MNANSYSTSLFDKEHGLIIKKKGVVSEILKCTPSTAKVRETLVCYDDLPITFEGQEMFMDVNKKIFKHTSTERDCNDPAIFEFMGELFYQMPYYQPVRKNIKIIQPTHGEMSYRTDLLPFRSSNLFGDELNKLGVYYLERLEEEDRTKTFNHELDKRMHQFDQDNGLDSTTNPIDSILKIIKDGLSDGIENFIKIFNRLSLLLVIIGALVMIGCWLIGMIVNSVKYGCCSIQVGSRAFRLFKQGIKKLRKIAYWTGLSDHYPKRASESALPQVAINFNSKTTKIENDDLMN